MGGISCRLTPRPSNMWRGIMSSKGAFESLHCFWVRCGHWWENPFSARYLGGVIFSSFTVSFSFSLCFCGSALMSSCFSMIGFQVSWDPIFMRNLSESKELQFLGLSSILSRVSFRWKVLTGGCEELWRTDGFFSVASFFAAWSVGAPAPSPYSGIWKIKNPKIKVLAFGWLAILGRILMQDNLWKCKMIIVNGCPLALKK